VPAYLLPEGARPPKEKVWAPYNKPNKKDGKKKQGRDPMKSFKA
jgi:hypothetical protein